MNREDVFSIWAPVDAPWTPWAKPVLYSFMSDEVPDTLASLGTTWDIPLLKSVAILIELPGSRGVEIGMSLAQSGYRPVPLYNACPYGWAATEEFLSVTEVSSRAEGSAPSVIDLAPIMRELAKNTSRLESFGLPSSAPPAFLLDASRSKAAISPDAGWFDNRSIIRESDVPTAASLKQNGIQKVVLVRENERLQKDLQAVLLSWQQSGISVSAQAPLASWAPVSYTVPRLSLLELWWNKLLQRLGYRLNSSGSFGRFVHGSGS